MTDLFLLSTHSVAGYLASHRDLAGSVDPASIVEVLEVGDGNLNLVFLITDADGNRVVLKQSLPHVQPSKENGATCRRPSEAT